MHEYTEHLTLLVRNCQYSKKTASQKQKAVIIILKVFHDSSYLLEGISLLNTHGYQHIPTRPNTDDEQEIILGLLGSIFEGYYKLVINNKQFPYKLDLPVFVDEKGYRWLFPYKAFMKNSNNEGNRPLAVNYENGCIYSAEEMENIYRNKFNTVWDISKHINQRRYTANKKIREANDNCQHLRRRQFAYTSAQAFAFMFIINTGMNLSNALSIKWDDSYSIEPDVQGFRSIKYRAQGKEVKFIITNKFIIEFKRFLQIRKYLLNGVDFDYLFLSFGHEVVPSTVKQPDHRGYFNGLYDKMRIYYSDIPTLSARKFRALKSDYLLTNHDVSTTALLLQNSERTVKKSYSFGLVSKTNSEMSGFFETVSDKIKYSRNKKENNISIGSCNDHGSPIPDDINIVVNPDCKQPEGCLFCTNYYLHADETDIRKLISCKYVINISSHNSNDIEHFNSLFGEIIFRIDEIIKYMKSTSLNITKTIGIITREVEDEGILDEYWDAKLSMLINLGVV